MSTKRGFTRVSADPSPFNINPGIHWGELFLHKSSALPALKRSFLCVIEFLVPCTVIDGSNEFTHAYTHTLDEFQTYLLHGTAQIPP